MCTIHIVRGFIKAPSGNHLIFLAYDGIGAATYCILKLRTQE